MTHKQIIEELEKKSYHPVYFLSGEEAYYIDLISGYIEKNILKEEEKTFNQHIFYGRDTDISTVINTAKRFPMMASHQVVILKEAQNIRDIDKLGFYLDKPLESTLLVVNYKYKKLDKRTKLYKSLQQKSVFFESPRLYDNKVPAWIADYLKKKNYELEPGVGQSLTDFLGNDLSKIVNELEKLIIVMPPGSKTITASLVERNIGISKDYNNFEFQKALARKDILKANRIIQHFCNNPKNNPMPLTIASLHNYFTRLLLYHYVKDKPRQQLASVLKINPYFINEYQAASKAYPTGKLARIISYIREYDLKSKGVNNVSTSNCELLKELVFKILH